MKITNIDISEQISVLKWLLGQKYRAKKRREELESRLQEIKYELNCPIGGVGYSPLPRSNSISSGSASVTLKISEIEERIYNQKEEMKKAIVRVMDIIDYIPENTDERRIFELHHIDGVSMDVVARKIPMSKSQTYERYNNELMRLLTYHRIQKMIEDAYDEWNAYSLKRSLKNVSRRYRSKKETTYKK